MRPGGRGNILADPLSGSIAKLAERLAALCYIECSTVRLGLWRSWE
jgi:hypothetical protein